MLLTKTARRLLHPRIVFISLALLPTSLHAQQTLRTLETATLTGEVIEISVPSDIRPGDSITGSIRQTSDSASLTGAVVEVDDRETRVADRLFKFSVPLAGTALPLVIKNASGVTIAKASIPVASPAGPSAAPGQPTIEQIERPLAPEPGTFAPLNFGQAGRPTTITGNFDGDSLTTSVSVGSSDALAIAESPRATFVEVPPSLQHGKTSLTVSEGGVSESFPFQVATLVLSANRTTIRRGQRAKISVEVRGLEGLNLARDKFRISIKNDTPSNIRFSDGGSDLNEIPISPEDVRAGSARFNTRVVGVTPGSFGVTATLESSTCTDCWKTYTACLAPIAAEEKRCYKNCDDAKADKLCYIACSTAARLQEAECFTAYIGCMRKKLFGL